MAVRLDNVWRGLEVVDGLTATKLYWAAACGPPLFRFIEPFLIPTGGRAEWIPDPTDRLRQMRVISAHWRKGSDFLAVSEEEPRSPNVPVKVQDLAIYQLDLPRFGRQLATALGFVATIPVLVWPGNIIRLAFMTTHGLDVVLALPCHDNDLLTALNSIRDKIRGEFALITPTIHTVVPHVRSAIDSGAFQHATLTQLLLIAENGELSMISNLADYISPSRTMSGKADQLDPAEHVILGDLKQQMAEGFESIRGERIDATLAANEMRKELADISGRADEFLTGLIARFGDDRAMADLFMRMLATGANGKPLSYAQVGNQMGVTKQAVEARFRKMETQYPAAYRHLRTLRAPSKTTQFSAISPTERRKKGLDGTYDYDVD